MNFNVSLRASFIRKKDRLSFFLMKPTLSETLKFNNPVY